MKNLILINKDDLKTVAEIKGRPEWFRKNRLYMFAVAGWFLFVLVAGIALWSSVYHRISIRRVEREYKKAMTVHLVTNDSLNNVIEERSRYDAFVHNCYAVMTTPAKPVTHDDLWNFIKACEPWYPDIIMTQAVQESGCGKSAVAKRCNNLFGMTKPGSRKWRCDKNRLNKKEKYAEYEDWRFSVIDRILWERWVFRKYNRKPTVDEYMKVIENVYSETDGYGESVYKNAAKYRKMME